ncbi:MAG TPA: hypothetical protein VGE24_05920, partial [Emticicia sp.]
MAKRVLLFVVFCLVSIAFAQAQCNKNFMLSLNNSKTFQTRYPIFENPTFVCKGNVNKFEFFQLGSEKPTFKWYLNDTLLVNSSSPEFSTNREGTFRIEVIDGGCKYSIEPLVLKAITTMDVYMSSEELTICENVTSPIQLWSFSQLSANDFTYQWQKDGKDIPQEKYNNFAPSKSGLYSIRVTAGNCSATSAPIVVKASPDNIIRDYL